MTRKLATVIVSLPDQLHPGNVKFVEKLAEALD